VPRVSWNDERRFLDDLERLRRGLRRIGGIDRELDAMRALRAGCARRLDAHRHHTRGGRTDANRLLRAFELDAVETAHANAHVALDLLSVHDLQAVHVLR